MDVSFLFGGGPMVRIFMGQLSTAIGMVECVGSLAEDERGGKSGVILCRSFPLSGFLTFDLLLLPVGAANMVHSEIKAESLRTRDNGAVYVISFVIPTEPPADVSRSD